MTRRRRPPTKRCRASHASRATRFCQSAALSRRKARGILGLVPMTAGRADSTPGTAGTAGTSPFREIRAAQCASLPPSRTRPLSSIEDATAPHAGLNARRRPRPCREADQLRVDQCSWCTMKSSLKCRRPMATGSRAAPAGDVRSELVGGARGANGKAFHRLSRVRD